MSNKKKEREIDDIMKDISELEDIVSDVGNNFQQIEKDMLKNKPNIDFSEMEKAVDLLTKAQEKGALSNPDNTDEEYDYYISDTLKEIWDIVEATPNNMALGKKIRQLYFETKEATPDPLEEAAKVIKEEEKPDYEQYEANNVIDSPEEDSHKNPDQLELPF